MKKGFRWNFFRNLKIEGKALMLAMTSVVLTALTISFSLITVFNDTTHDLYLAKLDVGMNELQKVITENVQESSLVVDSLHHDKELVKAVLSKDKKTLDNIIKIETEGMSCEYYTILDKSGNVITKTVETGVETGIKYTDMNAVKAASKGEVGRVVEATPDTQLSIVGCAPVENGNEIVGYIIAGYDLSAQTMVEGLKEVFTEVDFTIFLGDTRISTTVKKDGVPQVGTQADSKISSAILSGGTPEYVGDAKVLEQNYLVKYLPMLGSDGSVIGMIFAGTPKTALQSAQMLCFMLGGGLAIFFIIACGIVIKILFSRTISKPIAELVNTADELALGDVSVQLEKNDYKDEIAALTRAFRKIMDVTKENADLVGKMADGNFDFEVNKKSEADVMSIAVQRIKDTLGEIVSDIDGLAQAAINGNLKAQIDPEKHSGQYQKIVEGINGTLSTIVSTLQVGLDNLTEISKGNTVDLIDNTYKGDYYDFIENINTLNTTIKALQDTVTDLIAQAQGGSLSYRADAGALQGNYAEIIAGINELLDTVILPVNESAEVLEKLAQGNLDYKVEGDYVGDHAKIKNAVNDTIDNLAIYINDIKRVLIECSNGNLDVQTTAQFKGEFVQLGEAIEKTVESFNETLIEINNASDQVAAGARQVSDAGQSLSQGATEQAGSVEELSATIAEIAQETQNNALLARQSDELGNATRNGAIASNEKMNEMLQAMNDINESSNNISKIIKVIDDIAFQTNILALNAAVEAARAGQYGKGFAVVAEEVRTLAAKSATAANETTALIETSITKVEEGTQKAEETAENLKAIIADIEKSTDLINKISNSSDEQAAAVAQINKGIEQVAQVTQTNSATAEESAAASEELSSQAEFLKQMVGKFNFKNEKTDDFFAPKKASRKADVADFDDDSFGKY